MKFFVVAFALCLAAYATAETNPGDAGAPSSEYLPPVGEPEAAQLAEDGYRYRAVRKLRYRHRREVSQEYLPPNQEPSQDYLPPVADTKVADDGYRYKTVRRLRFRARHRRDVSEIPLPSSDYLPPVDVELAPDLKTVLGADGYRYKTVRRLRIRRRRREAEPEEAAAAESADAAAPANEYLPPNDAPADAAEPEPKSAELGKDGYRYKTVRRIRYRYRH